jgi:hypothetical protein
MLVKCVKAFNDLDHPVIVQFVMEFSLFHVGLFLVIGALCCTS